MLERQQLLLQQLGIQQWVSKQQVVEKKQADVLWRDQQPSLTQPDSEIQVSTSIRPQVAKIEKPSLQEIISKPKIQPIQEYVKTTIPFNQKDIQSIEKTDIAPQICFEYQILIHENFLILAEIKDSVQQQLLNHIQTACFAEQHQLKWALNISTWQNHDQFVTYYLQGFFAIHSQKLLILLGDLDLPNLEQQQIKQIQAPSLQQMLESPNQKRTLWNIVYPLIYDVE